MKNKKASKNPQMIIGRRRACALKLSILGFVFGIIIVGSEASPFGTILVAGLGEVFVARLGEVLVSA